MQNLAATPDAVGTITEEDRYRVLVHALTDYAVYMLDPDGTVVSWNTGAERFKGYRAEEIIGRNFSCFYPAEDRAAGLPQRVLAKAASEGRFEGEGWRVRKDGTRFWAHVVVDPIRQPDGTLIGFAKVTRDLTERRHAEQTLRRSEEQFRRLVESVTDYAIYMLDPQGQISTWNLGAERIKGYTREEIIGEHFSRFYTEEDRAGGEPARALRIAAEEGRFEKVGWRVRKDGTRFWASVVIDAIRDPDGTLIGFAKVTRDITERLATQKALEEARQAFFQAQKMDAVGQLTGGIAHDFNNLLMAVIGSLEMLKRRLPDDPRMHQLLDNAVQGAERGAALTKRMLAFARRQDLVPTPIKLPGLVEGMMGLLQRSLGPQIVIETEFVPGLPAVLADSNQLELALLNLAVNGRDAMPNGGTLRIAARHELVGTPHPTGLPDGPYVCLSVTDSGTGMDATTLERATEPFFTTKGVGKGTGLGLSMVHGTAEQLAGRLRLHSEVGRGTTVEIWLPVADATTLATAELPSPSAAATVPSPALTVLAVDDDGLVLMNTAAMLEDLGHQVFEAGSGRQALEILAREPAIDLVITDQAMPQMTGVQLAEAIRRERPNLPILIATGYAELPPGNMVFPKLDKPFFEQQLVTAIARALRSN
jgi:PAS domain S-box-containing protein